MYQRLVVATRNRGKVKEIAAILGDLPAEVLTLADFPDAPDVVEDGTTFAENAAKKARIIADYTECFALADDSGLEVDALGGQPGVFSARFSGCGATDAQNLALLLDLMRGVPDAQRSARFRCAVAVAIPRGSVTLFEGQCEGRLGREPRGENGFGYDPVFLVGEVDQRSFAELPDEDKNAMSHRGRALEAAKPFLFELIGLR